MKSNSSYLNFTFCRYRVVDCLVSPALHVDGDHALNFITDTLSMLNSAAPVLSPSHRGTLERALARRILRSRAHSFGHAVVMDDKQWRSWRDIRGLFLAMRYAHERRAALSRTTSPARSGPLSIPLPEAAA